MPSTSSTAAGGPRLGAYGTQGWGRTAPRGIVGGFSIAHAWAPPNTMHHPWATCAWVHTGSAPGWTHGVTRTWGCCPTRRCPHHIDTCAHATPTDTPSHTLGHGQGADTGAHPAVRTQHAWLLQRQHRAPARQLWHTGSGARHPRSAHLHKQHFFLPLTYRQADKQTHTLHLLQAPTHHCGYLERW